MFYHLHYFKFRPEVSEIEIAELMKELAALQDKIPVLKEFWVGKNDSPNGKGFQYGEVALFEKKEDLKLYDQHPEHKKMVKKIGPKCSGPAFFVEILARPKIWRLVSTRRQVLTGMCQICERVVSDNPRNPRRQRAPGPVLYHIDVRTPHARGMFGEKLSIAEKFRVLEEIGYDGVELNSPGGVNKDEALAASRETGFPIHGVVDSIHWGTRLSSPDKATRRKGCLLYTSPSPRDS